MKKILMFMLALMVVLSGVACSNQQPDEKPVIDQQEKVAYGSTLTLPAHNIGSLCPLMTEKDTVLRTVFEGLISLSDTLEAQPCLAESWSVSDDGKLWTLKLRSDVKWHDGTGFTADDVVYTVNQIKLNEESVYNYNVTNIADIRAAGKHVVEIEVNNPWPNYINLMYFPIVKKSSQDIDPKTFLPIGTGAYAYKDENDVDKHYFVRNDNWWGGKPVTECIVVEKLVKSSTALYAFGAGKIDMTMTEDVNWGKFVDSANASYKSIDSSKLTYIGVNNGRGALQFAEIRRAISNAVNREKLVDEVMMNFAVATRTPAHPNWKISENKKYEIVCDTESAKADLEANGWFSTEGCWIKESEETTYKTVFTILCNEESYVKEAVAEKVKLDMEILGMMVEIEKLPYEEYEARIMAGEYDLFVGESYIAPDMNFSFFIDQGNIFRYYNEEMTAIKDGLSTEPQDRALLSYGRLLDKFNEENPAISLFFENKVLIYTNRLEGDFKPTEYNVYNGIDKLQKKEAKS